MEKLLKFKKLFVTGIVMAVVAMFAPGCSDDDDDDPLYKASISITGGSGAEVCADEDDCTKDESWGDVTWAYQGERVSVELGTCPGELELVWRSSPASLPGATIEDGILWSFDMPGTDVVITVDCLADPLPAPVTLISFSWDTEDEGALEMVLGDFARITAFEEVLEEYFDEACDYLWEEIDEENWTLADCQGWLSAFPLYPGIRNLPLIFDAETNVSRRNAFQVIDNAANSLLTVGKTQFTAVAEVFDDAAPATGSMSGDDGYFYIVANYEIEPATIEGDTVDYTLAFDIYKYLNGTCDNSPQGECILFGEGEDGDEIMFPKAKARGLNFVRRVQSMQKVADGVNAEFWVIRTSNRLTK